MGSVAAASSRSTAPAAAPAPAPAAPSPSTATATGAQPADGFDSAPPRPPKLALAPRPASSPALQQADDALDLDDTDFVDDPEDLDDTGDIGDADPPEDLEDDTDVFEDPDVDHSGEEPVDDGDDPQDVPSTVREGDRGEAVVKLQTRLKDLGYLGEKPDGVFGPHTRAAVIAFQKDHGLTPDGIAGENTWRALSAAKPHDGGSGGSPKDVQVKVPFISQWTQERPAVACYRTCVKMEAKVGIKTGGPDTRIQVASGEDKAGHVKTSPESVKKGRDYIDGQINAGKPVVVGVSYKREADPKKRYNEGITDHFVLITGRHTDPKTGETYYTYHNPGSRSAANGGDTNPNNRLYVDPGTGNLVHRGSPHFELAQVRRNYPLK
ncbi:MAG TPA: peptidoglycan-binding domain-containing protein [Myxococcales bacterium]|nr:peptidoglycan-binding domain-containing protein [Myxococcales bacterium]